MGLCLPRWARHEEDGVDVAAVVTAVATLLGQRVAGSVADRLGTEAVASIEKVVQFLHRKLAGDPAAETDLATVEANPDSPGSQERLSRLIEERAMTDQTFLRELVSLVRQAEAHMPDVVIVTNVSGSANVGKIANFGNVRGDVSF